MDKKGKEEKWAEKLALGVINGFIAITLLLNGFTYLFEKVSGGYNKHNAWVVMFSKIEGAWWKYVIVIIFAALSYWEISKGIKLFKNKS